jgi:hypothetical protein
MNSIQMILAKRVSEAEESDSPKGSFKIPFANGVTLHLRRLDSEHHVGYMSYKDPADPVAPARHIDIYTGKLSGSSAIDAKLDIKSVTLLAALLEYAANLTF